LPPRFIYVDANAEELLDGFIAVFPELAIESRDTIERLSAFARGEDGGFTAWIADEFQRIKLERDDLLRQIQKSENENKRIRKQTPPPQDLEERLDELRLERKSLRELVKEIERKDVLGFLTEHGILPNYAFPEEGIHLKSVIYRRLRGSDTEEPTTTVYEYARSASAGLSDFAPPSRFYAEGRQVRIDEINLDLSEIELWRVCPACTFMERVLGDEVEKPCPSCGSDAWRDNSQKREFIRLRQVVAVTDARRARIGDDSDEREIRFFDRSLFPSFHKDAVEEAYQLADAPLPFGFEYIRQCNFREINFGEPREGQGSFRAAGRDAHGGGFQICRHCGKLQGIRRRPGESSHKPRCPAHDSTEPDSFQSISYLYREFPSEAIRILMPISALDADKGVQSFVSGLNLGLRLHFEGKVDHLRTVLLEASEGIVTRRYLYLYDSVPGGTGYLKQLMTRPDDFRAIFERALRHMQRCGCNSDATKDGCYRCVYAYREASRMAKTSRNHAVAMFTDIISHWPSLQTVGSVGDIKGNALLESELEAMFVSRLEHMAQDCGGTFRAITIDGKKGYFIKLGKDAPAWEVEPQVWLNERFMMPVKTRADFLLRPKAAGQDVKPVAIYVDGWETHQDRIASDMEKRLAAMRTGQCLVWSLSYYDLSNEFSTNPVDRTAHLWQPFEGLEMNYDRYFPDIDCSQARRLAAAPLARVLQEFLTRPDAALWKALPGILSLSTLLSPTSNKSPESIRDRVKQAGGEALLDHLEELGDDYRSAMFSKDGLAFVAAMPKATDLLRIRPMLLLADTNSASLEMRESWNTALRLLNLLQFSHWVHVAPHSNPNMPLPRGKGEPGAPSDDWTDIYDLTPSALHAVLDHLKAAGVAPPVVGYELLQGVRIVAEAELAWPDRKVCVALAHYMSAFADGGWKITEFSAAITDPNTLLDKFKI
jgi:DEAD/DEAH box helicase domain-containing protein